MSVEIPYRCHHCNRTAYRRLVSPAAGSNDESARIAGWRIGEAPRVVVCPACAGTHPDYWERVEDSSAHVFVSPAGDAWPFGKGVAG